MKKFIGIVLGFLLSASVAYGAGTTTISWYTKNGTAISPYAIGAVQQALTVSGLGTSTFSNGIQINGGCVSVGGSCVGSSASGSNYWTLSGSNIYNNTGTNVGIGTTTPWASLSVKGNSDLGTNALAGSFTATSTTATSTFANGIALSSGCFSVSGGCLSTGTSTQMFLATSTTGTIYSGLLPVATSSVVNIWASQNCNNSETVTGNILFFRSNYAATSTGDSETCGSGGANVLYYTFTATTTFTIQAAYSANHFSGSERGRLFVQVLGK